MAEDVYVCVFWNSYQDFKNYKKYIFLQDKFGVSKADILIEEYIFFHIKAFLELSGSKQDKDVYVLGYPTSG